MSDKPIEISLEDMLKVAERIHHKEEPIDLVKEVTNFLGYGNVVEFPKDNPRTDDKGRLLYEVWASIKNLEDFIVKNSVDPFNETDLLELENSKNELEKIYEITRRK